MAEKTCWFRHDWGRWKQYEERGRMFAMTKAGPSGVQDYIEVHQARSCGRCGKVEDQFVKDGPLLVDWTATHA